LVDSCEPIWLQRRSLEVRLRLDSDGKVEARMSPLQVQRCPRHLEPFTRVLPDRLEHQKPVLAHSLEQACFDKRIEIVERCVRYDFCCSERERAREHSKSLEQASELRLHEVVTPLDGCAQRALACGHVSSSARK